MDVTIEFGNERLAVTVPADRLIPVQRPAPLPPIGDPGMAIRAALETPIRFPPLRRALTPDDHVTVLVDERVPHVAEALTAILEHIASAGVAPEAITLLLPPGSTRHDRVDQLPEEFASVQVTTHDPADRKQLAYLASTRAGRRVYLNRLVIDADQLVVLTTVRFDALSDRGGTSGAIFPAFSDTETRHAWDQSRTVASTETMLGEPDEVSWLLGAPFLVQVVEGAGDTIAGVIAGTSDSVAEGRELLERRWRGTVSRLADTTIASMSGDPAHHDMSDLARALDCAARVVRADGTIVLLCQAHPALGEGFRRIIEQDEPEQALRAFSQAPPDDWASVYPWLRAARHARVVLHSGIPAEAAEGLFATPLDDLRQVRRLIDAGGHCVFLPDAHKLRVTIND